MTDSTTPRGEVWMATRFSIVSERSFEDLVAAFEHIVPAYPADEFKSMIARGAPWEEVVALTETLSPLGLLVYWKDTVTPIMALAGNTAKCVVFFIGNFPVAERMYRHDPRVMHFAPLRMTITEGVDGVVRFTTDKPSTEFESFGDPAISAIGDNVDRKVASLLTRLELSVPEGLISA